MFESGGTREIGESDDRGAAPRGDGRVGSMAVDRVGRLTDIGDGERAEGTAATGSWKRSR